MYNHGLPRACGVFTALLMCSASAYAQAVPDSGFSGPASTEADAQSSALQDIVVTAQRRSENLQKVPIVVSSIGADALQSAGITSTERLASAVPGLTIAVTAGTLRPYIRGIGTNANAPGNENPVALYVDGVYIAAAAANVIDLSDVTQISVLKGPQGTLFGRNASAGVIQVATRAPTQDLEGRVGLSVDSYYTTRGDVYVSGGLGPDLAASLTAAVVTQGKGYGQNLASGSDVKQLKHSVALRAKLFYTPSDDTTVKLAFDFSDRRDSSSSGNTIPYPGTTLTLPGYRASKNKWDIDNFYEPKGHDQNGGASLTIEQNLDFARLTSISAYRWDANRAQFDGTNAPTQGLFIQAYLPQHQFSQELQLASPSGRSLTWLAGLYYFNNVTKSDPLLIGFSPYVTNLFGIPFNTLDQYVRATQHADSIAGFAQTTFEVFADTHITTGLRYTWERRTIDGGVTNVGNGVSFPPSSVVDRATFKKLTWRAALDHQFTSDILGYVSYNRGFKSGGFNPIDLDNPFYKPETVDAYEAGIKTELFDRDVRLNVGMFLYDYRQIQVTTNNGNTNVINNAAAARLKGVDVDFEAALVPGLKVSGGFEYVDAKFKDYKNSGTYGLVADPVSGFYPQSPFDASGQRLPFTPKLTLNTALDYEFSISSGAVHLNVNNAHNSGYAGQPDGLMRQKAFDILGASVRWMSPDEKFAVAIFGTNLLNNAIYTQFASAAFLQAVNVGNAPRIYGIRGTFNF